MFLRSTRRHKDGQDHRYYSVVENIRRPGRASPYHKMLLYLGELNDTQSAAWTQALEVFEPDTGRTQTRSLFPADRPIPAGLSVPTLSLRVADARAWAPSREGTQWARLLEVLVLQRLIAPGSEWRAHRCGTTRPP